MGLPAARQTDLQVCPAFNGIVPHVGGIIAAGCPTVLIGGLPAARLTDQAGHGGVIVGPGCPTVLIG